MTEEPHASPAGSTDDQDVLEGLQASLTDWRTKIDELVVQLDLAGMELREALAHELAKVHNAGLALKSGLRHARQDLMDAGPAGKDAITEALVDLQQAFDAARAVVTRR